MRRLYFPNKYMNNSGFSQEFLPSPSPPLPFFPPPSWHLSCAAGPFRYHSSHPIRAPYVSCWSSSLPSLVPPQGTLLVLLLLIITILRSPSGHSARATDPHHYHPSPCACYWSSSLPSLVPTQGTLRVLLVIIITIPRSPSGHPARATGPHHYHPSFPLRAPCVCYWSSSLPSLVPPQGTLRVLLVLIITIPRSPSWHTARATGPHHYHPSFPLRAPCACYWFSSTTSLNSCANITTDSATPSRQTAFR